jgi:hypothetical protein
VGWAGVRGLGPTFSPSLFIPLSFPNYVYPFKYS